MRFGEAPAEPEDKDSGEAIISHLGGYHRCRLGDSVRLEFVSDSLSSMLGYSKPELMSVTEGYYTALMHPDDSLVFEKFARRLSEEEGCESMGYRLVKRDGTVLRVVDTMASIRGNDGCMRGYSVVCEDPDKRMDSSSASLDDGVAVLKVSGGIDQRIELVFGMAEELLSIERGDGPYSLRDFISMLDRDKVEKAVERAFECEHSGMVPCTIVSADGRSNKCDLWLDRLGDAGCFEDASFCVKIERDLDHQRDKDETLSYGKELFSSFAEEIFEIDRLENSVKYICHSDKGSIIRTPFNVRMNADDFLEWFLGRVSPDDRESVKRFCIETKSVKQDWERDDLGPSKIEFEMVDESDLGPSVALVMVPISPAKYFLCLNTEFTPLGSGFCSAGVGNKKRIVAKLFGSFKFEVDGEAVFIKNDKARELLALLIEKRGAFLTTKEAITTIWECRPDDFSRARYRKTAFRLTKELKRHGVEYLIESDRGARRILPEFIDCDYYDYRDGLSDPSGEFLPEYSWSEFVRID